MKEVILTVDQKRRSEWK